MEDAAQKLVDTQSKRIRIAGIMRALPDAILPGSIVLALVLELPARADAVSMVMLAGLAADPIRKAAMALEYRTAFVIARQRLQPAVTGRKKPVKPKPA